MATSTSCDAREAVINAAFEDMMYYIHAHDRLTCAANEQTPSATEVEALIVRHDVDLAQPAIKWLCASAMAVVKRDEGGRSTHYSILIHPDGIVSANISLAAMAVIAHEIGHALAELGHMRQLGRSFPTMVYECDAWAWAIDHWQSLTSLTWQPECHEILRVGLETYCTPDVMANEWLMRLHNNLFDRSLELSKLALPVE